MKKLLVILAVLVMPVLVNAATLNFDAAPRAEGYNVHWGIVSGNYPMSMDIGNVTSVAEIVDEFNLDSDTEYFFAVTAYNAAGESGFSNEANYTTPYVLTVPGTVTITISAE